MGTEEVACAVVTLQGVPEGANFFFFREEVPLADILSQEVRSFVEVQCGSERNLALAKASKEKSKNIFSTAESLQWHSLFLYKRENASR